MDQASSSKIAFKTLSIPCTSHLISFCLYFFFLGTSVFYLFCSSSFHSTREQSSASQLTCYHQHFDHPLSSNFIAKTWNTQEQFTPPAIKKKIWQFKFLLAKSHSISSLHQQRSWNIFSNVQENFQPRVYLFDGYGCSVI